jgi:hypothetical protein
MMEEENMRALQGARRSSRESVCRRYLMGGFLFCNIIFDACFDSFLC